MFEVQGTRQNLESILNFQKHIGFDNRAKRQKLNKSIKELLNNPN
jgi:intein-encoded DNA endonuclease-like protein